MGGLSTNNRPHEVMCCTQIILVVREFNSQINKTVLGTKLQSKLSGIIYEIGYNI